MPQYTVKAFVEMARFLLKQGDVKFLLSERFCQDPVEEFFGHQRAKGGRCDNPTVNQFLENTVSLRIQKTVAVAMKPPRGNCSKRSCDRDIRNLEVDNASLQKRKVDNLISTQNTNIEITSLIKVNGLCDHVYKNIADKATKCTLMLAMSMIFSNMNKTIN